MIGLAGLEIPYRMSIVSLFVEPQDVQVDPPKILNLSLQKLTKSSLFGSWTNSLYYTWVVVSKIFYFSSRSLGR